MTKDLTKGNSFRLITQFCIPMILGNLLQQLYNMVDTMIVGRCIGEEALAGVGLTGSISFVVIGFALGICTGFSIPVAQAFGAGDYTRMRQYIANAYYLAAAFIIILTVPTMLFASDLLTLMHTPDNVFGFAYSYIIIIFAGIVCTVAYNLLSGILRAVGDSITPIIFLGISAFLNICLDFLFIIYFRMGVVGAAAATVAAQGFSSVLCFIYIKVRYPVLRLKKEEMKFSLIHIRSLAAVAVPMALQFSITGIGSIILQSAVNTFGSGIIAGVTAGSKIENIFIGPLEAIGITMATFSGQNLGAGKIDRIRHGILDSHIISMSYCALCIAVLWFFGQNMASLFTDSSADSLFLGTADLFLKINVVFFPLLGILFILRNSLQGMGFSFLPMLAGVLELLSRSVVGMTVIPEFGYKAVFWANPIAWIAADILLISVYIIKIKKLSEKKS